MRVAGPFTVESVSPHRMLEVDEHGETFDRLVEEEAGAYDFARVILDNLKTAGVQQARREDRIEFSSLVEWPGDLVCAEGRYREGETERQAERRAAIFIGPEFGTVSRPDLVEAAKEAAEAGFDALIACAFNYDAHTTELEKLGRIPVLKARMNADLHMAGALKNTGAGNLFVIFGEPDIDIEDASDDQIKVRVKGVDVFHPASGEVRSDNADGIACWFVDTDYNEEAFFVRQAYFLGANDPYKSLKTTLKAEIDAEAWATLHSDTSRPFNPPRLRPHRRKSNQPPRRRGNESLPRVSGTVREGRSVIPAQAGTSVGASVIPAQAGTRAAIVTPAPPPVIPAQAGTCAVHGVALASDPQRRRRAALAGRRDVEARSDERGWVLLAALR